METVLQDLRYAVRTFRRQRAFTAIAVLTLAVGIGANTAIYSVVDATLLRTLPFKEPDRLMRVSLTAPGMHGGPPRSDMVWSYPKYEAFRDNQQVFEITAIYRSGTFNLTGTDEPERLQGEIVSASYFPVLGINGDVGRTFAPEEDVTPEKDLVVVLSHSLWQRRFGGDRAIIGKPIGLDLKSYTVVGVLPAGFQGLTGPADIWLPVHMFGAEELGQRWSHSWNQVARLKPGVSVEQAKNAMAALGARVEDAHPDSLGRRMGSNARTLAEARIDPALRKSVLVLFGAVSFVLLIACVNIANLLLARGSTRQREVAIRLAVGASRGRLVRQLLTESLLLSLLGAVASLAFAWWGVYALSAIQPASGGALGRQISGLTLLGLNSIRLDSSALLFTFAIALATGVLFGIVPALQNSRAGVTDALKTSGSLAGRLSGFRILTGKSVLVVTEVALAVVLLVAAGLMIKSFGRLITTRTGVDPDNVLTLRINLPQATSDQAVFFSQLEHRIASLPGVISSGMSNCHALAGGCNGTLIWFRDRPPVPRGSEPTVGVHWASPDYIKTMKIPLLRGRWFTESDRRGATKVVVINDAAARRFWPGEDPIGKPIGVGQGGFGDRAEIIGIVGDVRYGQMDEPPQPDVYINHLQSPRSSLIVYARMAGNPLALTQAVRREVLALNKDLPVYNVLTMRERIANATARARFSAILLGVFGAIALILAAVGIYGVMSYLVTQRTREVGIRMALGARSADVLLLVVRRGAALTLAGIVIGVAGALAVTRVLSTLLYEVKPGDPATYVVISLVLASVALMASYIPARRASWVEPSRALRAE